MNKKVFIILIIIIAILMIILGIILFKKEEEIKNAVVEITLSEDRTVEFLADNKVSDFILSINGKIIDDYKIDTTIVGKKTIDYEFINDDGIRLNESYDIEVVDNVAPIIWLSGSYTTTKGSGIVLEEKILCADNYDDNPICKVNGEYDLEKVGTYPLTFEAIDNSGNKTTKEFNLIVKEPTKNNGNTTSSTKTNFIDIVSKYKSADTEIGIDISKWQGDVDFEKLRDAGVEFVFIRVGSANGIDGERFVDSKFLQNIKNANEVGIPVGIYYYSYANTTSRAKEDAEWILEQIKDYKIDLPIAFDWENWANFNKYHISLYHLKEIATSYLDVFKSKGYTGLNYSSKTYLENMWMDTGYDVWLAHYTTGAKPSSYEGAYSYWQVCNNGKVEGINGDVDIDIRYLNK